MLRRFLLVIAAGTGAAFCWGGALAVFAAWPVLTGGLLFASAVLLARA